MATLSTSTTTGTTAATEASAVLTLRRAPRRAVTRRASSPAGRLQQRFVEAGAQGRLPTLDAELSQDVNTLVERLRRVRALGGMFAELTLGPALAALHVQGRLAQG